MSFLTYHRRDLFYASLAATGLAILLVPFARIGVDPHHDGIMLKPALDVLAGQTLFRDTFMQYGALTCYLQVAALWIQPTLLCLKLMTATAYVATLLVLYATWRLLLPRSLTLLSCGLFILFLPAYEKNAFGEFWVLLPWSSVLALLLQSLGLYALLQVIRHEQAVRWAVTLGLACAGAFWCRQSVGVFLIGAVAVIGLALHWTGWRPAQHCPRQLLLWTGAGLAGVSGLLLGVIVFSGAAPEWWYQNFTWPRQWALSPATVTWPIITKVFLHPTTGAALLGLGFAAVLPGLVRRFWPAFPTRGLWLYFSFLAAVLLWQRELVLRALALREGGWPVVFPLLILLHTVVSLTRGVATRAQPQSGEHHLVAAFSALSLASILQYYPVPDPWHVFWSLAPAFGLCVHAFWRWSGWSAPVVTGVILLALLPALSEKNRAVRECLAQPWVTLSAPSVLRGMRVEPELAQRFGYITAALAPVLRAHPALPSALIGDDALYLCFTDNRTNPTPYFVTWQGLASNEENQRRWDNIHRIRPLIFLLNFPGEAADDFYQRAHYVPVLYARQAGWEVAIPRELSLAPGDRSEGQPAKP
jgi:hypothetical protein